ncbi:hypothetical protein [Microbacterium sp. Se63.02b]|uniref:hypothetical protein n=1 Tax=Microbacterium sp. Se63.02b TaxID=2709304 RepID=UPI001AEDF80B|nr:hypothetical protein [Microbacterium sp. Se63.02b]
MTFEEGLDLASDTYIEWGDGFLADERWETVSPDDGNGGWTYGTADGTCTVRFWQGHLTDVPVVDGDDSASSDAILGVLLETPTADITPVATTGEFSYMAGGSGGVEMRQVSAVEGSRSWLMAARVHADRGRPLHDRGLHGQRRREDHGRRQRGERDRRHAVTGGGLTCRREVRSAAG